MSVSEVNDAIAARERAKRAAFKAEIDAEEATWFPLVEDLRRKASRVVDACDKIVAELAAIKAACDGASLAAKQAIKLAETLPSLEPAGESAPHWGCYTTDDDEGPLCDIHTDGCTGDPERLPICDQGPCRLCIAESLRSGR